MFTCYVCGVKNHELLGKTGNLIKHLNIHQTDSKPWLEAFNKNKNEIGSITIPRYTCTDHKINLAIRKAIKSSVNLTNFLTTLSKFASQIKKSINLSSKHANKNFKIHR